MVTLAKLKAAAKDFESQLLPCPFCGSSSVILVAEKEFGGWECHGVECEGCDATSQPRQIDSRRSSIQFLYPEQTAEAAIKTWNTRAKPNVPKG